MRRNFDKSIDPCCEYCCNSKMLSQEGEMLCSKYGVVLSDYSCKQFKYNPLKRIPKKAAFASDFSEEDFSL